MADLASGDRIGVYEIRGLLGRGGMGEVYRAHDSRLRRDVAIKILPASFAADPDRLGRFEREARVLATLTHPNVAAIYGIEANALVLELVEGDTLAEYLQRGVIPLNEIIAIARQIAEGLEAAHEAGIVHRDLKPANIKITGAGLVKLLDFGIAKIPVAHDDETRIATEDGQVIGTTAYMSPEQARGRQVDKRTDIWSYGCVLFEMLTRKHAFAKATTTDTLVAIVEREPDWSAVPASTPPAMVLLLRRCLTKETHERLRDIGEARIALKDGRVEAPALGRRSRLAAVAATAAMAAAMAGGYLLTARPVPPAATISFPINPPPGTGFYIDVPRGFFDIAPDGSRIAFEAGNAAKGFIWTQTIGELQPREIPGTEGGGSPEWSPDGESLAFFADDQLKRVHLRSGVVSTICDVPDVVRQTASWGRDGRIAFASNDGGVVFVVSADGGTPEVVVTRTESQLRVHFPMFLPDGRRFLYVIRNRDASTRLGIGGIGVTPREIGPIESNLGWVEPDILLSARAGALVGQHFDLESERLIGEPIVIADQLNHFATTSRALFSASANGTIAYHSGLNLSQLTWFDRAGRITGTVGDLAGHLNARLSPDGTRIVFDRTGDRGQGWDLWITDLARNVSTRVTSDPRSEVTAVWLEDGRGIIYGSDRSGSSPHLYRRDLETGLDTMLRPAGRQQQSWDVSPDGQTLVFIERSASGNFELFTMPLARPEDVVRIGQPSRFTQFSPMFSPDNRAIAYTSNRAGRVDVYVSSLTAPAAAIPVSPGGGHAPRWSRDGRELLYLTPDQRLMSVAMRTSPSIVAGMATPLFSLSSGAWSDFDPAPDGRLLAILMKQLANDQPIVTIVNWRPPGS